MASPTQWTEFEQALGFFDRQRGCPRDSQESSPTPQFESINSLVLSLLDGPTLASIHDYWKNLSFDYSQEIFSAYSVKRTFKSEREIEVGDFSSFQLLNRV